MPKATVLQQSFNTGEISPMFYGRVGEDRYKAALATALNIIPTLQGPMITRPGTKYVVPVSDPANVPILIPYTYSLTTNYMLEFGSGYIRFYTNNGQVVNPNATYWIESSLGYFSRATESPLPGETINVTIPISSNNVMQVLTPYALADLPLLKWVQDKDTLYLVHPKYPPMTLKPNSTYEWYLSFFQNTDGPYNLTNTVYTEADGANLTLIPSGTNGTITLSAGPNYAITGAANNGAGLIRIACAGGHSYLTGAKVYIAGIVGTVEANNTGLNGATPYWIVAVIDTTHFDLIGSAFVNAWSSGGFVYPALFWNDSAVAATGSLRWASQGRQVGLIDATTGLRLYGITTTPVAAANILQIKITGPLLPNSTVTALTDTKAISFWYLGTWIPQTLNSLSANNNDGVFPSCACFHQDRLFLSGSANFPDQIDSSMTGIYNFFSPSNLSPAPGRKASTSVTTTNVVGDNNAIQFRLLSRQANPVFWLASSAQGLLAGTYEGEWTITPDSNSSALSPTNINAIETSYFGSANANPVQLGNATLYIQRAQRKVREMNFFFQVGTFRSTDLTELSEHITIPTIKSLSVQKETQPLVWALRSDGTLVSMIYNRDDLTIKAGWTRHQLGGQSDSGGTPPKVLSIGVIPDPTTTFDQLWMVVQRWINGAATCGIEYMTRIFDDSVLQEDAFQLDCGSTFDNPLTITGISTAATAVVTSAAHGLANGAQIKITNVVGLNEQITDVNGNVSYFNLVNELTFVVAGSTTNTFQLNDFNGQPISSLAFSAYVSGGQVRKLVSTVSGLTYLENETVSVLADGGPHPPVTISNSGVLTLKYPAAKVQIGYPYNSDGQLVRSESGSAEGTSIGQTRRVNRAAFMLHRAGNLSMGMSFTNLIPASFLRADVQNADNAMPLYSGIHREGIESTPDFDNQLCFRMSSPTPGMIQTITTFLEEQDV